MSTEQAPLSRLLEFCSTLRGHDLPVGTDDAMAFASAIAVLDSGRLEDIYWAGRTTLVHSRAQIPVYDACFARFFLGGAPEEDQPTSTLPTPSAESDAVFAIPGGNQPDSHGDEQQATLGLLASGVAVQHSKDFSECTEEELAAIRKIVASLSVDPPVRRTRRDRPSEKGRVLDMRRMAREMMRNHGETTNLALRVRKTRPRRLVLILDISGSMADYSRHLLQFAHSVRRGGRNVEVFCFGTHLTRITASLRHRDADEALSRAGAEVLDWAGGTRIGDSLDEFVRDHGRRGTARGAIVVICSDGLDRGDPAVLDAAMERLSRLSYRIVWMNPMVGEQAEEYVAASLGMSVAMPYVDLMWSGHNLASLVSFADALPDIR